MYSNKKEKKIRNKGWWQEVMVNKVKKKKSGTVKFKNLLQNIMLIKI